MFSGGPAWFIRAIRGVKNGCSVLYVAGYCNNHPVIVGRNINASVNFYWLIKFCLLNLYTEFLSVCVHELIIWRINTVLHNGTNPPVFAGSGRMFWRSAGRQRPGQKNGCVLHC